VIALKSSRYIVGVCVAVALLAGCGGGSGGPLSPWPLGVTAERTHSRLAYSLLYSFKGWPKDGEYPGAGLIDVNSTLYGTTFIGGRRCPKSQGCGTVFGFTKAGRESVLRNFDYGPGGDYPTAGLLNVNGTLYGTTYEGGESAGEVYAMTTSGKETVLHSFNGSGDGAFPHAGLTDVDGTLYSTTVNGGANCGSSDGCGTIFKITTSGTETVIYSFKGGSGDGAYPYAGLVNVNGTLYGTTENGGGKGCYNHEGCGTVFAVTASGKETVLHTFGGSEDGHNPSAGLTDVKGTLYGTTINGGADCRISGDMCGTVFAITTSGKETVLHTFGGSGDGYSPSAGLIDVKGTLYGTTYLGGANYCSDIGCGTVFAVTTSGTETVLHSFAGYPTDGELPQAGLLNVNGALYGTTWWGGTVDSIKCSDGCGTIFSLTP
jgi:uncharacterized repeat protein (TIGR03803 family)